MLLAVSVFLFFSASVGLSSVIARYAEGLGAGAGSVGFMFSLASFVSAVLRVPVGLLADRFGSLLFMGVGLSSVGVAGLVAVFSTGMQHLYLARLVQGVGIASFIAPSIAAASLIAGSDYEAARALSYRSAAISLAITVSPLLASWLVDALGYRAAFLYVSLVSLAGFVPLYLIRASGGGGRPGRGGGSGSPRLGLPGWRTAAGRAVAAMVVLAFLDGSVFISLQAIPQYQVAAMKLPARVYGGFLAVYGFMSLASRLLSHRVMRLVGAAPTIASGTVLEAVGLLTLSLHASVPALYMGGTVYGIGRGLVAPSSQYVLLASVPREVRNTVASLYAVGVDMGGGLGTVAYSKLVEVEGYRAAYLAMALAEVLGLASLASLLGVKTLLQRDSRGESRAGL
ncbi:MAG: hypothetical protein DSY37_03215 [Hyperthermus sp.]|nr:MAG: hypothetical protein DSY37_03215 [Hyperthermus sp.]